MTAQDILFAPNAYRLKVEDYRLLDQAGAFKDFAKTELIEGVLVTVNAQYTAHARVQKRLLLALDAACRALDAGLEAWLETSIAIDGQTMPQPDCLVARDAPANAAIPVSDVLLVLEVAGTTAAFDLGAKARVYAAAGVPEYWVAEIDGRVIHQMWLPGPDGYAERREVAFGERIVAATIEGLAVETAGL